MTALSWTRFKGKLSGAVFISAKKCLVFKQLYTVCLFQLTFFQFTGRTKPVTKNNLWLFILHQKKWHKYNPYKKGGPTVIGRYLLYEYESLTRA